MRCCCADARRLGRVRRLVTRASCHSLPLRGRWPSAARSDEVAPSGPTLVSPDEVAAMQVARRCRFQRGRPSAPARKLAWFRGDAGLPRHPCAGANAAPAPAQGASPLDPFSLRAPVELAETAPLDPFSLARFPGGYTICRALGASYSRLEPSRVTTTRSSIRTPKFPGR